MKISRLLLAGLILLTFEVCRGDSSGRVVDLGQFPPDSVWRTANSTIKAVKDPDGTVVWRWEIGSGEGFLWLNEKLPIHAELPKFQRLMFDVNFAEGQINQFWPRTMGQLAPPFDKMFCEWNLFYFTHPHKTWLTYQQVFNDPSWFAHSYSPIPENIQLDRSLVMGFSCLAKGQSCVVELRNCRLIKDKIRVEKPYLTTPIGWPVAEGQGDSLRYRTPYFVKNVSDKPVTVTPALRSEHSLFKIIVEPPQATIAPGKTQRFDVVAALVPGNSAPPMSQETAVVEFVPDGDKSLAYRTETFCTLPLPKDANRMVLYSPQQMQEMKKKSAADPAAVDFWMSVNLENQTEIPHGVGHTLVMGIPVTCAKCQKGKYQVTSRWLEAKCDKCGHTEYHTLAADATWLGTWSTIHRNGPDPGNLGLAYLASGDEKYAKKAIALLTLLGSGYGQLTWHNAMYPEGWPRAEPPTPDAITNGASARWGNAPTYGTNFIIQGLATLHNLVVDSPSWTDAQRKQVHEGFWIPAITEIIKLTPGISNMNDIINRDLILAGLASNDANMVYRGTLYPTGIVGRMRDISPDGFSDEGSAMNYHFAAMREWLPSIELLVNSNIKFAGVTDRVVAALKMPIERAALNGVVYCTGNSGQAWFHLGMDYDMFLLADRILPADMWPRERHYDTEPILFRDAGWATMRTGKTIDKQVMVNVDFGRSHGHGDLDRMNLGLLAFGVPLSADPGSAYNYYSSAPPGPAESSLTGPLSMNTVCVDGQQQIPGAGKLVSWDIKPDIQQMSAQITGIYLDVGWRRSVALVDDVTVVVDDLRSDRPRRYESSWHHYGHGNVADGCELSELSQPLGEGAYKYLLHPKKISGEPVTMDWIYKDVHVRATQPAEPGQLAYTAQTGVCFDNVRGLPVDGMFVRREGKTARFVTVLEPYKTQRLLKSISSENNGAMTKVKLVFADGHEREITFDAAYAE